MKSPLKTVFITFCALSLLILISTCANKKKYEFPFQNHELTIEERVNDLVSRMTLEEKVSQMVYDAPAISRLGVSKYNWWNECLHGVARAGLATVFPQPVGLAAIFDDSVIYKMANVISTEARAKHHEFARNGEKNIYQGLTFWSPNINIFRDPRWGRGMETYGEDPYLTGKLGIAFVQGLQGNDPNYFKVIATAKHYVIHSGPEPDRHSFDAVVDDRDFRETYTPAFEALVKEGKAYSVMCAYNRYKGEACCGSNKLLNEILRKEWDFKGYIVSDCWAISDFWNGHKITKTTEESVALAVKSGTDLECGVFYPKLQNAVKLGLITEKEIDIALKRLMTARFKLGMFDPEDKVSYAKIPYSAVDCEDHRKLALDVAKKSIVLLKNENQLLPLKKDLKQILVCGPNATNKEMLWGNYNGFPSNTVVPLEGIRNKVSKSTKVIYEKGCDWIDSKTSDAIPEDLLDYNGSKGFEAEYYTNMKLEGKPSFTRNEKKVCFLGEGGEIAPGIKNKDCSARWITELTAPETGEFTFVLKANKGAKLFIDDENIIDLWSEHPNIKHFAKINLTKNQKYKIKVEYFQKEWNGEVLLEWIMPGKSSSEKALELAKNSDVIVMFAGITPSLEGEEMPFKYEGFSGGDRTSLNLPKVQVEFLKNLKKTGVPIVLVLLNGSALSINWENDNIPAIVEAWYGGQAAGTAIADVLFGDYNPAGRLPVTFYKSVNDLPDFKDYNMKGRTYRYFEGTPLFPFGYGLSYTTFKYDNIKVPNKVKAGENITVEVDVQNTGKMDGDEVVQLYVKDVKATVDVPLESLQGFKRIHLKAGEKKKVLFTLTPKQLSLLDKDYVRILEPGIFEISVGGSQPLYKFNIPQNTQVLTSKMEVFGDIYLIK